MGVTIKEVERSSEAIGGQIEVTAVWEREQVMEGKVIPPACLAAGRWEEFWENRAASEKFTHKLVAHPVQRMLEVAEIKKGDILYDMGSGDDRIVIEAAKKYGIRGVGIDLNAELVAKARENAANEGVNHLVEFRAQDGLTVDISEATVVTLYKSLNE